MATRSEPSLRVFRRIGSGGGGVRPGQDGVPGVRQDIDQRQPQPLGVGDDRAQGRVEIPRHRQRRIHAHRLGRIVAERVEIGGRHVELDRPGEVEHLGHDPVEPGDLLVDVGDGRPDASGRDVAARAGRAAPS